jgi:hypothetical protein
MIVQAYFRFSYEDFEPMLVLSHPINIGNVKLDGRQIVIKEEKDLFSDAATLICLSSMRTSPPDQIIKILRRTGRAVNKGIEKKGLGAFGAAYEDWGSRDQISA